MATKAKASASASAFSAEEKAAMKEHVREVKAKKSGRVDGEATLLAKIAEMAPAERAMAERVHAIVRTNAPSLAPTTWYGMPAYANEKGKAVCFFKPGAKFKMRYAELGFNDAAKLDDGGMWPSAYALVTIGPAEEKQIAALVKKAAGA